MRSFLTLSHSLLLMFDTQNKHCVHVKLICVGLMPSEWPMCLDPRSRIVKFCFLSTFALSILFMCSRQNVRPRSFRGGKKGLGSSDNLSSKCYHDCLIICNFLGYYMLPTPGCCFRTWKQNSCLRLSHMLSHFMERCKVLCALQRFGLWDKFKTVTSGGIWAVLTLSLIRLRYRGVNWQSGPAAAGIVQDKDRQGHEHCE